MKINEVVVPEDLDFALFRRLCDENAGWDLVFSKKTARVWTKATPETTFRMIKIRTELPDVSASVAYDVLHDPVYRAEWDKHMLDSKDIGVLCVNSDLCYYAIKSPKPFRNRDFVLQRVWLERPDEMIIFNHSVCHDDFPPKKGFIRAVSYLTGYLIRPLGESGCQLTYVSQSDPKGSLPSWAVNKLTHMIAPSMLKSLQKACLRYQSWKSKTSPTWKPWLYPEQQSLQRIDLNKCKARYYVLTAEEVDESSLGEEATPAIAAGDESDEEWSKNGS